MSKTYKERLVAGLLVLGYREVTGVSRKYTAFHKAIDRHGQPHSVVMKKLGLRDCRWPYTLRMVRGIFVVKWILHGTGALAWKEFPHYAALGPKGKVISGIGSRQDTITAAGGRMD